MVGPLAGLLLQGAVTGSPLQPYEVHLNFQTQVFADLHLRGMSPVFVQKPYFRTPVLLDPLIAAGVHKGPHSSPLKAHCGGPYYRGHLRISREGEKGPLGHSTVQGVHRHSVLGMLGEGAVRTFTALGWGQLLHQISQVEQASAAATAAPHSATDEQGKAHSSKIENPTGLLCEKILQALPPEGPEGLRLLKVPRYSKCMIEVDARMDQVLNPIVAAEKAKSTAAVSAAVEQQRSGRMENESPSPISVGTPSSIASANVFLAQLVGSVADYWREETARASAWGLPPPSANGSGSQEGLRDPQGAPAPELWRTALENIIRRVHEWQERQQDGGKPFPLQGITCQSHLEQKQQEQRRSRDIDYSLLKTWEASELSETSDSDSASIGRSPRYPRACVAPKPPEEDSQVAGEGTPHWQEKVTLDPLMSSKGRPLVHGLCSSQDSVEAARLLVQATPPSQRPPVGIVPPAELPLEATDDLLGIEVRSRSAFGAPEAAASIAKMGTMQIYYVHDDLKDEEFSLLLASHGTVTHSDVDNPMRAPGLGEIPDANSVERQVASDESSADSSNSRSPITSKKQEGPRKVFCAFNRKRGSTAEPRYSIGSCAQCRSCMCRCCAPCNKGKQCVSDMEDILQVCDTTKSNTEDHPLLPFLRDNPSRRSSTCEVTSLEGHSKLPDSGLSENRASRFPAKTLQNIRTTAITMRVPPITAVPAALPGAVAAESAGGFDAPTDSSSYAPTVRLEGSSSCDDLSPTQSIGESPCRRQPCSGIAVRSPTANTASAAQAVTGAAEEHAPAAHPHGRPCGTASSSGSSKTSTPVSRRCTVVKGSGSSQSSNSVVSISPPPDACTCINKAVALTKEEMLPFYSDPRDVPAATNPLRATPGGRLQQKLLHCGFVPPPCTCRKHLVALPAAKTWPIVPVGQGECKPELRRLLRQQQRVQQRQQPQEHTGIQQHGGSNWECFVYFQPPPDMAQVYATCPSKVRRKWHRTERQGHYEHLQPPLGQQKQEHLPQCNADAEARCLDAIQAIDKTNGNGKGEALFLQEEQIQEQHDHTRQKANEQHTMPQMQDASIRLEQEIACSSRNPIGSSNKRMSESKLKMQVSTRLDNHGRIVGYVAPVQQEKQQAPSREPANTSQSSNSSSQHERTSQVSLASDVRRAKKGLFAQQTPESKLTDEVPGAFQTASYGTLLALEVIAECRPAAATEAAAAAATPNPGTCSVLAICFILRDERLKLCTERMQQQVLYSDVNGVIIFDSQEPSGPPRWCPPCPENSPGGLQEHIFLGSIDSYFDSRWWRCIVSSEKELLLQFCGLIAAADPSLLLQWEDGGRGLAFLRKRADALGLGQLFRRRCSRRSGERSSRAHATGSNLKPTDSGIKQSRNAYTPTAFPSVVPVASGGTNMRKRRYWMRGSSAIPGRLVLEGWRLLQKEVKLQHSDLCGTAGEVLGLLLPSIPQAIVAAVWEQAQQKRRRRALQNPQEQQQQQQREQDELWALKSIAELLAYVMKRVSLGLRLVDSCEVLPRTSELARLYGCCLHSALTRGSHTIEGAKSSVCAQVDPVESETKTLGVLTVHAPPDVFAWVIKAHAEAMATRSSPGSSVWAQRNDAMRVLPGGSIFVSPHVRQGILPAILNDILQTRVMVKQASKRYQGNGQADEALLRKLDYRQFGLKMIANVTYGYTNANVSGRMPCSDVADAIVETAKATLIRAMQLIEQTQKWGARVLYGDTDSMFVLLKDRSLEAAFSIGREIADAVTRSNPAPITLQLEKVYLPCCLVTKKRYVGNAYFSPSGPPIFDAKGIETIRRDQCPLTSAILEKSLRLFFETRDLSKVKQMLYRQWSKMLRSQIPIRHYIFHRKAKLGTYRAETGDAPAGTLPPQAKVLYERLYHQRDYNGEASASYGIRVPFVFSHVAGDTDVPFGASGALARGAGVRLVDCATSPDNVYGGRRDHKEMQQLLSGWVHPSLRPLSLVLTPEEHLPHRQQQQEDQHPVAQVHHRYYITRQIIPALDRVFSLLPPPASADLLQWFRAMPKPVQRLTAQAAGHTPMRRHQLQRQKGKHFLLKQLGIRSITAEGTRERLVLQKFFAATSCLFCGGRCKELDSELLAASSESAYNTRSSEWHRSACSNVEEPQEIAIRKNFVQQLQNASFGISSSGENEIGDSQTLRTSRRLKEGYAGLTQRERVLVLPPICEGCSNSPALICVWMHQRLNKIERRLAVAADFCRQCAGSRLCADSCLQAWHCDVYFRRSTEADKLRALQRQMQSLGLKYNRIGLTSDAYSSKFSRRSRFVQRALQGQLRSPPLNLLQLEDPLLAVALPVGGHEDGHSRLKYGGTQGSLVAPNAGNGSTVLAMLESLLVRGLWLTVSIQAGSPDGPSMGLQPIGAVLYLPFVREGRVHPKLQVHIGSRELKEWDHQFEVNLSVSTVSFCSNCWSSSLGGLPEETVQHKNPEGALQGGNDESHSAMAETKAAECSSVRLISACGSLICFVGGPHMPLENQVTHDVLRIFRAFEFDTSRLYGFLSAAIKSDSSPSPLGYLLESLPLFALSSPLQRHFSFWHTNCRNFVAARKSPFVENRDCSTAPAATHLRFKKTAIEYDGYSWHCQGASDPARPWPSALACSWITHIAIHADGVRERHALLCAFRRVLLDINEKSSGMTSALERPSKEATVGLESTIPSETTIVGASFCGDGSDRCSNQRKRPLNPNAAPFVPRASAQSTAATNVSAVLHDAQTLYGAPLQPRASATAVDHVGEATTAGIPLYNHGVKEHLIGLTQFQSSLIPASTHNKFEADIYREMHPSIESFSSTLNRSSYLTEPPGRLWSPSGYTPREGNMARPHRQKICRDILGDRPPHLTAPRPEKSWEAGLSATLNTCQYTPMSLVALRRYSLLRQPICKTLGFVLHQKDMQRRPESLPPLLRSLPFGPPFRVPSTATKSSGGLAPVPAPYYTRGPQKLHALRVPPLLSARETLFQSCRGHQPQMHIPLPSGCACDFWTTWEALSSLQSFLPSRKAITAPPLLPNPKGATTSTFPLPKHDTWVLSNNISAPFGEAYSYGRCSQTCAL
ncbi:uncharacterized protein LOC34618141 [Cyclospora cayetanensis]|uniref:DNA-directed DNA polymerase n=1 Tax=Cyclospora cayetanensis TaxID=88456 RepID=A0A6P6RZB6_9EIME|nr:uncharacterized protein LOC34618141 [Cyclospora cayetanensis]